MKQMRILTVAPRDRRRRETDEGFKLTHVFAAFASLPRVLRLVWSTNPWLTGAMAGISLVRGFLPAITLSITSLLIDSVVHAIRTHIVTMVWWYVTLQLVVGLLDRLLAVLSNIIQQLLQ